MPDHGVEKKKGSHVAAFLLSCGEHVVRYAGLWMTEKLPFAATATNAQTVMNHGLPECLTDRTT